MEQGRHSARKSLSQRDGRSLDHPERGPQRGPASIWFALELALVLAVAAFVAAPAADAEAAECDRLEIPTVGIERCVVSGDQPEIDAGRVARVDRLSTPTVHWLVGHRTTHGRTFRDLPRLRINEVVSYRGLDYRIKKYQALSYDDLWPALVWSFSTTPSVLLQTSRDSSSVHVWLGEVITPPATDLNPPPPIRRGRLEAGASLVLDVPGGNDSNAVVLNVTAVNPDGAGFVTAYACGATRPTTSNLNYSSPTSVEANLVIVTPNASGQVCLYSNRATDVVVDSLGTITNTSPFTPTRLRDTRS